MVERAQGTGSKAQKRSGLGRGLGALIPQTQEESMTDSVRPLDVLFPGRASSGKTPARGGSARDLLNPPARIAAEAQKASAKKRVARTQESVGSSDSAEETTSVVPAGGTRGKKAVRRASLKDVSTSAGSRTSSTPHVEEPAAPVENASEETQVAVSGGEQASISVTPSSEFAQQEAVGKTQKTDLQGQNSAHSENESDTSADAVQENHDVSRETSEDLLPVPGASFATIPLELIVPNTKQPREVFDEEDLEELAASIQEVGVLQPIVVRRIPLDQEPNERLAEYLVEKPEARFELIMGERRLRASERAGETTIPAIIRQTEDEDLLRDALLENLHRAQLNPLEEAFAYQQLMADFGATQEELSKRIARSRPQIANTLRLLKLPPAVQKKVSAQVISAGHARALLGLATPQEMEILADRIVAEGLSVRTTEELVRLGNIRRPHAKRQVSARVLSPLGEHVLHSLEDAWDTRVSITEGRRKGKIVIEFAGYDDLQRLADLILPQLGGEK